MCWETDYWYFAEQEKARKAEAEQKRQAGVVKNLLDEANKQADASNAEPTATDEVVAAK